VDVAVDVVANLANAVERRFVGSSKTQLAGRTPG
jgi:hypothetical protein